jgi:hypothetical protein
LPYHLINVITVCREHTAIVESLINGHPYTWIGGIRIGGIRRVGHEIHLVVSPRIIILVIVIVIDHLGADLNAITQEHQEQQIEDFLHDLLLLLLGRRK